MDNNDNNKVKTNVERIEWTLIAAEEYEDKIVPTLLTDQMHKMLKLYPL